MQEIEKKIQDIRDRNIHETDGFFPPDLLDYQNQVKDLETALREENAKLKKVLSVVDDELCPCSDCGAKCEGTEEDLPYECANYEKIELQERVKAKILKAIGGVYMDNVKLTEKDISNLKIMIDDLMNLETEDFDFSEYNNSIIETANKIIDS